MVNSVATPDLCRVHLLYYQESFFGNNKFFDLEKLTFIVTKLTDDLWDSESNSKDSNSKDSSFEDSDSKDSYSSIDCTIN